MSTEQNVNVNDDVDTGDPSDDESDGAQTEAKVKRHRTSPRVKVLDQVLAMIDSHLKDGVDTERFPTVADLLSDMRSQVVDLATMDPSTPATKYAGRHYVGIGADGVRMQFQANNTPTKRNIGEKFTSVIGPFRTADGAGWVVKNGPRPTDKVVF